MFCDHAPRGYGILKVGKLGGVTGRADLIFKWVVSKLGAGAGGGADVPQN